MVDAAVQVIGMCGLFQTYRRTLVWCWNLLRGGVVRHTDPPRNRVPMRSVQGESAAHALPGSERLVILQLPGQAECSSSACSSQQSKAA